ncbi:enoyl-[acyl-carrier-protein] reductase, mitochondrial isoform X2 [Anthonomus grandis grandis]|uniref:enoyl-[acyl-carrier-protein] reductase, mitochondrial isoform X2 n=1 Tax=Anthonomus grandis grandis TaxID=2921223 RepID=UPI0021653039|nr:enoyl-[acyl-carrier-protein] reductase, mitochondrial isoform X2 [Anthonomus grandis grandis]
MGEYGDPLKVIQLTETELPDPKPDEVLVKLLAAPVNPADINTIQGKYPSKPELPAVPGNEGVGKVIKVGSNVIEFAEGDHVIPLNPNLGTWRTHVLLPKDTLLQVPKKLGLVEAATLTVNPCTAYRMLKDFADLKPGDTVIQNGANSACGQNVIQICRAWGLRTVNIVRDRPNIQELKSYLAKLGATYVLTEEELRTTQIFKNELLDKPKLALNCVGGKNALECLRYLKNSSSMVTYGGMSRDPLTVPTSALIFKDLQFRGFWMTRWSKENSTSIDRFEMFSELISMMTSNELKGPAYEMVDFKDFKRALLNTLTIRGMIGKKFILRFE